ncbi:DUF4158 domain-containing protein [Streptomyces sp. NPDC006435]|uniref:DUF4158 domain-containing protein n=1 Tax=Streptomyces sp. NPDC006435 TaxID=3154300 RepID=UPI0033A8DF6B
MQKGRALVVRQEWEPEELISVWTLLEEDMGRLRNKSGANRLGFALLLKFFEVEARFPEGPGEVPDAVVGYVAQQVKVPAGEWNSYEWDGRSIKRHRVEIRSVYRFRETTEDDQAKPAGWLATELCPVELSRDRLAEAVVVARCRNERIEPPAPGQVRRLVASAVKEADGGGVQAGGVGAGVGIHAEAVGGPVHLRDEGFRVPEHQRATSSAMLFAEIASMA